jgi:DNA polymerase-3 subunit delta
MMIYILYGSDSFSRREAYDKIRRGLDTDGSLETNTLRMTAREVKPDEVVAACSAAPFLGDKRLVVVEGLLATAQESGRRTRKANAAEEAVGAWQALIDFAPQMPETTVLILLDGAVPQGNPLLKGFEGLGEVRKFPAPDRKSLQGWVAARAKRLGMRLDSRAAKRLADNVGGQDDNRGTAYVDTWSLAAELDKLAAYANGEVIRDEDVLTLSPVLREQKSYLLCDAVADRKPATAAKVLGELEGQREPMQLVVATVAGRYRRLAIARDMMDAGEPGEAIRKELAMNPGFGFDKLLDQASRYSLEDSRNAYRRIVEAELSHKSGEGDEMTEMHAMVQELASRR